MLLTALVVQHGTTAPKEQAAWWTYLGALPQDAVCWHVSILMAELF